MQPRITKSAANDNVLPIEEDKATGQKKVSWIDYAGLINRNELLIIGWAYPPPESDINAELSTGRSGETCELNLIRGERPDVCIHHGDEDLEKQPGFAIIARLNGKDEPDDDLWVTLVLEIGNEKEEYKLEELGPVDPWKAAPPLHAFSKEQRSLVYKQIFDLIKHKLLINIGPRDYYRLQFYKNAIYFRGTNETELKTITDDFDAEYFSEFYGDKIFIMTNKDAPNKKIYVADAIGNYHKSDWKELISESEYVIEYFSIINGRLYVQYLKNASNVIKIFDLEGNYIKDVPILDICTTNIWGKQKNSDVWVWTTSFCQPAAFYKYDFDNDRLTQYFMPDLNFRFWDYETDQVWYNSKDGTKVSMFIIKKKDAEITENTKVFMYAYGGFTVSITPNFASTYAIWLEAGGIIAIPNLRGGGEYGEEWHKAGMFENKQNVFDDYIAAAEWLKDNKYTSTANLVMTGGSNGGLLMGAMIVQRPDLMKAVYCGVPLLDMIRYHNSMIANIWKEEYGSAEDPEQFKYILKYSPYHNIKEGAQFPASIITAGINDARVDPYHARKFTAALRDANNSDNPILIQVQEASGHGGGTQISIVSEQSADKMAFLMDQVGLEV